MEQPAQARSPVSPLGSPRRSCNVPLLPWMQPWTQRIACLSRHARKARDYRSPNGAISKDLSIRRRVATCAEPPQPELCSKGIMPHTGSDFELHSTVFLDVFSSAKRFATLDRHRQHGRSTWKQSLRRWPRIEPVAHEPYVHISFTHIDAHERSTTRVRPPASTAISNRGRLCRPATFKHRDS